ncbi:hypothetical protein ACFPL7_16930 [Dongia soli]|uniref:Cell division protein FtsL n=1 Tax=Dongia soli TaxID=600628 RepID=A0ABU5E6D2_9PROT|nr:hypothetical protein [Dongia soli]MDY0881274.1 hypothetical protein [Dongia soli]
MIRISVVIWILVLALLGVGLFQVKYNVQAKETELRHLKRQIDSNLSSIHVLEAEWSYLNDPVRLADLARRHTDLLPTQASQIKNFADLPLRPADAPAAPAPETAPQLSQPEQAPTPPMVSAVTPHQQPAAASTAAGTTIQTQKAALPESLPTAAPTIVPVSAQLSKPQDRPAAIKVSAKPAATPAAKPAVKQPAATAKKPGSDEVIDAILADMQRAQDAPDASAAGDQ